MKLICRILFFILLFAGLVSATIWHFITSPITTNSHNKIGDVKYRIICYSEWEKKVLNIPIFIYPFELKDPAIIFDILNDRKVNNESQMICPSLNKLDSLLPLYNEIEIVIYKKNVMNVDEVAPNYYYKLTKYGQIECDSLLFTNRCFKIERTQE